MNRIVLAILALFAGLAAQVTPAEARLCGPMEVGASFGLKPSVRIVAATAAAPFRPAPKPEIQAIEPSRDVLPLPFKAAPTVRSRIDRARE